MSPTTDILAKNVKGNPASTEFPYVIAKAPKGDSNPHGFPPLFEVPRNHHEVLFLVPVRGRGALFLIGLALRFPAIEGEIVVRIAAGFYIAYAFSFNGAGSFESLVPSRATDAFYVRFNDNLFPVFHGAGSAGRP